MTRKAVSPLVLSDGSTAAGKASAVTNTTSGLVVVAHTNVQQAIADLDTAITSNHPPSIQIVLHAGPPSAKVGTWNLLASGSQVTGGYYTNSATSALNDYAEWDALIAPGTWAVDVLYHASTNRPIITVSIGGVAAASTVDTYAASSTFNQQATVTGIVITGTAPSSMRVRVQATSKNAASTAYQMAVSALQLRKTA